LITYSLSAASFFTSPAPGSRVNTSWFTPFCDSVTLACEKRPSGACSVRSSDVDCPTNRSGDLRSIAGPLIRPAHHQAPPKPTAARRTTITRNFSSARIPAILARSRRENRIYG
jgi:hypothetical protein